MKQTVKNYIYNLLYQVLILIIPFITLPYISRTLGSDGVGIYSFTYSIVYYFMMVAMLGINKYGNRKIAQVRDNRKILSKNFKEIYFTQVITSTIITLLYIIYLLIFNPQYLNIFWIQLLYIISCFFDINWLFFGLEKFKITVTRNTIIKIISLVLIFTFVKSNNDVLIYTLILSSSTLLSQLLLWTFVPKYIDLKEKIKLKDIFKHFIPSLKLFLPVIAIALYSMMDKTMLGLFSSVSEVGLYENAEKIYNVPLTIIAALGTVMLPKMSNMFAKNDEHAIASIIEKTISFIMFLSFPMALGLIAISREFSILFLGEEFAKSGIILSFLCIIIPLYSWTDILRNQYLIPKEMDKEYIKSVYIGAAINLIFNAILIPRYGSYGACVGTIIANVTVSLYQTMAIRKYLPIKDYFYNSLQFLVKSAVMLIVIYCVGMFIDSLTIKIILEIILGIIIYALLNYNYIRNNLLIILGVKK